MQISSLRMLFHLLHITLLTKIYTNFSLLPSFVNIFFSRTECITLSIHNCKVSVCGCSSLILSFISPSSHSSWLLRLRSELVLKCGHISFLDHNKYLCNSGCICLYCDPKYSITNCLAPGFFSWVDQFQFASL